MVRVYSGNYTQNKVKFDLVEKCRILNPNE